MTKRQVMKYITIDEYSLDDILNTEDDFFGGYLKETEFIDGKLNPTVGVLFETGRFEGLSDIIAVRAGRVAFIVHEPTRRFIASSGDDYEPEIIVENSRSKILKTKIRIVNDWEYGDIGAIKESSVGFWEVDNNFNIRTRLNEHETQLMLAKSLIVVVALILGYAILRLKSFS